MTSHLKTDWTYSYDEEPKKGLQRLNQETFVCVYMYIDCTSLIHTKSFIIDDVIVCLLQQVSCILQQLTQYLFIYLFTYLFRKLHE